MDDRFTSKQEETIDEINLGQSQISDWGCKDTRNDFARVDIYTGADAAYPKHSA